MLHVFWTAKRPTHLSVKQPDHPGGEGKKVPAAEPGKLISELLLLADAHFQVPVYKNSVRKAEQWKSKGRLNKREKSLILHM